jgi:alkylation response protein AidB-like acyl-CoA dehydrogenase
MDLRLTPDELRFRDELRDWLAKNLADLPPEPDHLDWPARRAYDTDWQRRLFDAGYAGVNWPSDFGGRGSSPTEQLVFLEESARAGVPYVGVNFVGLLHAGPTLIAEGTPEQQSRHLAQILRGDQVWCQGFSEPGAGSDLASLRTRAVRDGDHYVVNGSKLWTSHAEVADYCELLVRTDPDAPKHKGISWLILPMDLPGITVRPLRTVLGTAEFGELILDNVRVPAENLVGKENDGWRVTNVTLSFERGTAFVADVVESQREVGELAKLITDPVARNELAHIAAQLEGLWALVKRNVSEAERTGVPGVGGSVFKLQYSEARQKLSDLGGRVSGRSALSMSDRAGRERLQWLNLTIAAGTSQIQRNIIAERVLGLPRSRA